MKQVIKFILLSAAVASALLVSAFAEGDETQTGIQNIVKEGQTEVVEAAGAEDGLTVTYRNAVEGKEYLLIVQKDDQSGEAALPTESNIYYIDQKTAEGDSVSFDVYPKALRRGTYTIRVSSNDDSTAGLQKVGSFAYLTTGPDYYVVDLTEMGTENKDTNVLTVTSDKACVVLCSEAETNATPEGVKGSVETDWKRLNAVKVEGTENSYTFDLSECAGTVVIAVKGDYDTNGEINGNDYGPMVAVSLGEQTINKLYSMICDVEVDGGVDGNDYAPVVSVSLGEILSLEWDTNQEG